MIYIKLFLRVYHEFVVSFGSRYMGTDLGIIWELFGNYGFSMPVGKRHPKQLWSMSRSGEGGYSATGGAKSSSRTAD